MKTKTEKIEAILQIENFNNIDFDSLEVGKYYSTKIGDVYLESKPNIFQPLDQRVWVFFQVTDENGETLMDGDTIKIYS